MKKIAKFLEKNFWPILIVLLLLGFYLYKSNEGFKTYNKPKTLQKGVNQQGKDKKEESDKKIKNKK
jgi:hypothetical protein